MFLVVILGFAFVSTVRSLPTGDTQVAFSVGIDTDIVFPDSTVVVYNKIFVNSGNAYDASTGVFTAPKDGLYVFMGTLMNVPGKKTWLKLTKNGIHVLTYIGITQSDYDSSAMSIILNLVKGDRVYVKNEHRSMLTGMSSNGGVYTTFSGYSLPN